MSDNACCFCGDDVGRYGHNPAPVSDTGRCCDVCNQMVVIPARISMMGLRAETILPGNITDIIMDEYLEQGESYEDAQEYARVATEKLKLDAEMQRGKATPEQIAWIEAKNLEIERASKNPRKNARIIDKYLEELSLYIDSMNAEDQEDEIMVQMLEIEDMENPSEEDLDNLEALESRYFELTGTFGAEDRPQFPAEAIEELKKHIVVFTGAGMMLSVFAAIGGFLLGRRTKEC